MDRLSGIEARRMACLAGFLPLYLLFHAESFYNVPSMAVGSGVVDVAEPPNIKGSRIVIVVFLGRGEPAHLAGLRNEVPALDCHVGGPPGVGLHALSWRQSVGAAPLPHVGIAASLAVAVRRVAERPSAATESEDAADQRGAVGDQCELVGHWDGFVLKASKMSGAAPASFSRGASRPNGSPLPPRG